MVVPINDHRIIDRQGYWIYNASVEPEQTLVLEVVASESPGNLAMKEQITVAAVIVITSEMSCPIRCHPFAADDGGGGSGGCGSGRHGDGSSPVAACSNGCRHADAGKKTMP